MSIDQYSLILSLATLGLGACSLLSVIAYFALPIVRTRLLSLGYFAFIKAIGVLAITSTIGALVYQVAYLTPVCSLCWWQRIFMFPLDILIVIALVYRDRVVHVMTGTLAAVGGSFSAYHYYYHFQGLVLGNTLSLPCSQFGLLPACTDSPILVFGFVTIPLMALMVFLAIIALSFFASQLDNSHTNHVSFKPASQQ